MTCAIDECSTQFGAVTCAAHGSLVRAVGLIHHQTVALGLQGQDGHGELPIQNDVVTQIGQGGGIGRDLQRGAQGVEISVETEA